MKKIITLSASLLGVVFLAGCGQQQTSQTQPTTPAPVVQQPTQGLVYTNTQYGFQLTLPDSWKGYSVSNAGVSGELDIAFNVGGKNNFNIFSLYSVPIKEKSNVDIPAQGCIVGQTSEIVVLASDCCKGVEATAQTDPFDDFQKARCVEVPAILKTFRVTK